MPDLINLTEEEAKKALKEAGLGMDAEYAASETIKEGLVIMQEYEEGEIIDKNINDEKESPNHWFVGVYALEKQELEVMKKQGKPATYTGYGVLIISEEIDEETLFRVVQSIKIKGKVICSKSIKEHYNLK